MPSPPDAPKPLEHRRSEDFRQDYANNVLLESTAWDLTLRFGQLDLSVGPNVVFQRLGVTLPWPQVKVMLYLMQIHLTAYEMDQGRCNVPKGVIPNPPAVPTAEAVKENPKLAETHIIFRKLWEDFMKANPEAAPKLP